jgi:uncharacterized protein YlxP (DUF503 family)
MIARYQKLSIGYANICSSVQDQKQKFSVFNSSIGSEEQMRAMQTTKRKLVLQERGSEEKRF